MPDRSPSFARHSGHAQNLLCQAVAGGHCVPTPLLRRPERWLARGTAPLTAPISPEYGMAQAPSAFVPFRAFFAATQAWRGRTCIGTVQF